MVRCNLSILLAERGLKITKVSKDTGISRTTLTALSSNSGQGIQFETINTLCMYLKISPSQLIDFYPIDIVVESINDAKTHFVVQLLITDNMQTHAYKLNCIPVFNYAKTTPSDYVDEIMTTLKIYPHSTTEETNYLSDLFSSLPVSYLRDLENILYVKLIDILQFYPFQGICHGMPMKFIWQKPLSKN